MKETVFSVSIQDLAPIIIAKVNEGGSAEITVTGHSMMPLLLDRISKVRLAAIDEPKRGDMILYRRTNGTYVLHRLVKCNSDGTFTMCGDGQTLLENGLKREQLLATVEAFARRKRWRTCTNVFYSLWWKLHLADRPLRRFWQRGINFLKRNLRKIIK